MLTIKAKVAPSRLHGFGLFAAEAIPRGTTVWRFTPGLDLEIPSSQFEAYPESVQEYILFHGFLSRYSGMYHLSFDDVRYINHSSDPNVCSYTASDDVEMPVVAMRDIAEGEEILQDYGDFEADPRFS